LAELSLEESLLIDPSFARIVTDVTKLMCNYQPDVEQKVLRKRSLAIARQLERNLAILGLVPDETAWRGVRLEIEALKNSLGEAQSKLDNLGPDARLELHLSSPDHDHERIDRVTAEIGDFLKTIKCSIAAQPQKRSGRQRRKDQDRFLAAVTKAFERATGRKFLPAANPKAREHQQFVSDFRAFYWPIAEDLRRFCQSKGALAKADSRYRTRLIKGRTKGNDTTP